MARWVFGLGLVLTLICVLAIPDYAPLKQIHPHPETRERLAQTGLWRIGLLQSSNEFNAPPAVQTQQLEIYRACVPTPTGGWPDTEGIDMPRLAMAVMAAEAVSRPGWRQGAEVLYAQGHDWLGRPIPNLTYGPLQIRASRAGEHAPHLRAAPREHIVMALEDPCLSLQIAASLLSKALQETEGEPPRTRVLKAASDYSGYRGDAQAYAYSALALSAYEMLAGPAIGATAYTPQARSEWGR